MKIQPYINISVISIVICIISLLIEHLFPFMDARSIHYIGIFICRFLHILCFFYFTFFLFFFDSVGLDAYLYLFLLFTMMFSWYCTKICILSYCELYMYDKDIDIKKYETTFHPSIYSLFREHTENIMKIVGIMTTFTTCYILWKNSKIPLFIRFVYGITYFFLFIDNIWKTRSSSIDGGETAPKYTEPIFS